jgi:glycine dehydrogenase
MSGMYAVYHGPKGLKKIAERVNYLSAKLAKSLEKAGYEVVHEYFFDTIRFKADGWNDKAKNLELNLRDHGDGTVGVSLDETTTEDHLDELLSVFKAPKIENKPDSTSTDYTKRPSAK